MFRAVIVPLDGSDAAEIAIPVARAEADGHRASLIMMRVVPWPERSPIVRRHGGPNAAAVIPADLETASARQEAMRYLQGVVMRFGLSPATTLLTAVGDPYLRILSEIERRPGSVVVVTGGDDPVAETPLAAAARRILQRGLAPVLNVSPRPPVTRPAASYPTGDAVVGESVQAW